MVTCARTLIVNDQPWGPVTGTDNRILAEALAAKWVKESFMETRFGKIPDVPFSEALLRYAQDPQAGPSAHLQAGDPLPIEVLPGALQGLHALSIQVPGDSRVHG